MQETFKQRMKRIRLRAGFKSQQDAATAIGCERGTVGMWEAPSSNVSSVGEWLLPAAKAYKVRPEWINDLGSNDDGYPYMPSPKGAAQSQSQSQRHDIPTMAAAIQALQDYLEITRQPASRVSDPVMLELAFAALEELGQTAPSNVVEITKAIARLADDGQEQDSGDRGITGKADSGTGRAGRASNT